MNPASLRKKEYSPITIEITDIHKFESVALLVDRPDFLDEVRLMRRELKINQVMSRKFVYDLVKKESRIALFKSDFEQLCKTSHLSVVRYLDMATRLRLFFKKGIQFQYVIFYALMCSHVTDDDLIGSAYRQRLTRKDPDPRILGEIDSKIAIIINKDTSLEDVIGEYNRAIVEFKSKKFKPKYKIQRDRIWYWEFIGGKSYWKIAKEELDDPSYWQIVEKAVKAYHKRLI